MAVRVRVSGLGSERGLFVFEPGVLAGQPQLQVLSDAGLSAPSFVFEHLGDDEELSEEGHDQGERTFKVSLVNTSEKPVVLPQGAILGKVRQVPFVCSIDTDFENLEDYLDSLDDREPDLTPPPENEVEAMVDGLDISDKGKTRFKSILRDHPYLFALDPNAPPSADVPPHRI